MRAFNLRLKRAFDEEGVLFAGMMAAMAAKDTRALQAETESETPKDAAPAAATESPDQPVAAANPAGKTIVPPR
jgi:hypothetical protein